MVYYTCSQQVWYIAQNPLHTFPRNFPIDGEVANLLATSRCNGILETTQHNRHNGLVTDLLQTCRLCCGRVADLLRGSRQLVRTYYGETDVMDFGFMAAEECVIPWENN